MHQVKVMERKEGKTQWPENDLIVFFFLFLAVGIRTHDKYLNPKSKVKQSCLNILPDILFRPGSKL